MFRCCRIGWNSIEGRDKREIMRRRQQITRGIDAVRSKLEELSEQEYSIKMEFQKYRGLAALYSEEEQELRDFKQVAALRGAYSSSLC